MENSRLHDRDNLIALLTELADIAGEQTLAHFRKRPAVENKLDEGFDPVTEADRNAERALRARINHQFPDHGIIGEEFGSERPDAEFTWVLDPVDGTRAFIAGLPLWGTLIALYHEGRPHAGAMNQPFTGELFLGLPGTSGTMPESVFLRGSERSTLKTSNISQLDDAICMTTSPRIFSADGQRRYDNLESAIKLPRYGCDCYAYAMLAQGTVDLVAEEGLQIYDIAALIPVVEGAGGIITTWDGKDPSCGGSILASANEALHALALERLATA